MAMTVKQLIQELEKFPPDLEVVDFGLSDIEKVFQRVIEDSNYPYNRPDRTVVVVY